MLTPNELYIAYSKEPCDGNDPPNGKGTPYPTWHYILDSQKQRDKLLKFLMHLKYPCYNKIPDDKNEIKNTGANKLATPYKFLTKIDAEAFQEIQPSIKSGTSHAIRNACDLIRACDIELSKDYRSWESRMATEYLEHFGSNSLPDCLMMLGPMLADEETVENNRSVGCGDIDCVPNTTKGANGTGKILGARGVPHACIDENPPLSPTRSIVCGTCDPCTIDPRTGEPENPACCSSDCVTKTQGCCGGVYSDRFDFSYLVPSDDNYFSGNIYEGFKDTILKHVGILKRKSYGGYANFIDNSGPNFYACRDDIFLKYFRSINGYTHTTTTEGFDVQTFDSTKAQIDSIKVISIVNNANSIDTCSTIKDLIYNGYGVVLMTNVGFPNFRDSTGVSYPDRIWYHTFAIIGYDDTKTEFNECVYLLANSWGNWNSGGEPSWGPIPDGSFLVLESHLKEMVKFNYAVDYKGCRPSTCLPPCDSVPGMPGYDSNKDPERAKGCSPVGDNSCVPFECSPRQSAFGVVFALSNKESFEKRSFNYEQRYAPPA